MSCTENKAINLFISTPWHKPNLINMTSKHVTFQKKAEKDMCCWYSCLMNFSFLHPSFIFLLSRYYGCSYVSTMRFACKVFMLSLKHILSLSLSLSLSLPLFLLFLGIRAFLFLTRRSYYRTIVLLFAVHSFAVVTFLFVTLCCAHNPAVLWMFRVRYIFVWGICVVLIRWHTKCTQKDTRAIMQSFPICCNTQILFTQTKQY